MKDHKRRYLDHDDVYGVNGVLTSVYTSVYFGRVKQLAYRVLHRVLTSMDKSGLVIGLRMPDYTLMYELGSLLKVGGNRHVRFKYRVMSEVVPARNIKELKSFVVRFDLDRERGRYFVDIDAEFYDEDV